MRKADFHIVLTLRESNINYSVIGSERKGS